MKKTKMTNRRLAEAASSLFALVMLLGCGGNLSLGTDASNGGSGPENHGDAGGAGSQAGGAAGFGGFPTPNFGGYGPGNAGSGGGYAGSLKPAPGVECECDSAGDSVCSGSLAALCSQIPGCKPSLSDVDFSDICGLDPMRADYSGGERTIISYSLGVAREYQMTFDTASGNLLGGSVSGNVGLSCNLGGTTEFAQGLQVDAPEASCGLCSSDAPNGTGNDAGSGGSSNCPSGMP